MYKSIIKKLINVLIKSYSWEFPWRIKTSISLVSIQIRPWERVLERDIYRCRRMGKGRSLRKDWILSLNCKAAFGKFNVGVGEIAFSKIVVDVGVDGRRDGRANVDVVSSSFLSKRGEKRGWKFNPECQLSRGIGYRLDERSEDCARGGNRGERVKMTKRRHNISRQRVSASLITYHIIYDGNY